MYLRGSLVAVALLGLVPSVAAQEPLKNVQIFTGMSRPEVWEIMNQMASDLGVSCQHCHVTGDVASDAKPQKLRGREMIRVVIDLTGRIPARTDFDDYRDVGGFKLPFFTRGMLVDPYLGGTRQAESIEVGVTIPPGEFRKPPREP